MSSDPLTTELLLSLRSGDGTASDQLVSRLYEDLRGIARQRLRQLRPGQTMDTTSLVHEAYIRLVDGSRVDPRDRGHFLALASRAMRFVLVDHARSRGAEKRGGGVEAITLERIQVAGSEEVEGLLELEEALETLSRVSPRLAAVVEYRFYGGLTHEEIAGVTGQSVPTVKRDWARARAWLLREMQGG